MTLTTPGQRSDRSGPTTVTATPPRGARRTLAFGGLIARGIVYGVIGVLSLKLALGSGGKTTSQSGAMQTIAKHPFGEILLFGLSVGLAAYAIFRLLEGLTGSRPNDDGSVQRRVSAIASAIAYGFLCYTAIKILEGAHTNGGSPRQAAAGILGWPGGPVIVAIAGLVVIGIGIYQAYKGLGRKFLEDSDTGRLSARARAAFTGLGVAGHVARAVTFALIGYGLVKASLDYSPRVAVGLDGALQKLVHSSHGPLLLGIVAAGFVAFALYSIIDSRYHRV